MNHVRLVYLLTFCILTHISSLHAKSMQKEMANKSSSGGGLRIKTAAEYDRALKRAQQNKQPLVVKFYADWCGACKSYAPAFEEVAASMKGDAVFATLNIDDADIKVIAQEFNVELLPTTVIITSFVGTKSAEQLSKMVAQAGGKSAASSVAPAMPMQPAKRNGKR